MQGGDNISAEPPPALSCFVEKLRLDAPAQAERWLARLASGVARGGRSFSSKY